MRNNAPQVALGMLHIPFFPPALCSQHTRGSAHKPKKHIEPQRVKSQILSRMSDDVLDDRVQRFRGQQMTFEL